MLSLPDIVHRPATPYLALEAHVTLPFGEEIPALIGRLFGMFEDQKLAQAGPLFFKYNAIAMPRLDLEIGIPTDRIIDPRPGFVRGTLAAGRYAEVTHLGPYADLVTVTANLIGWARERGLTLDRREEDGREIFAGRLEIYHNSPAEEPDPARLRTTVAIRLAD